MPGSMLKKRVPRLTAPLQNKLTFLYVYISPGGKPFRLSLSKWWKWTSFPMKETLVLGAGLAEQGVAGFCVYLGALSGTDWSWLPGIKNLVPQYYFWRSLLKPAQKIKNWQQSLNFSIAEITWRRKNESSVMMNYFYIFNFIGTEHERPLTQTLTLGIHFHACTPYTTLKIILFYNLNAHKL